MACWQCWMLLLQESGRFHICSVDAAYRAWAVAHVTCRFCVEYTATSFNKCHRYTEQYLCAAGKVCSRWHLLTNYWEWQVADQTIDCSAQHNEDMSCPVRIKINANTLSSTENKCHLLMYNTYKDDTIGWVCDPQTSTRAAFSTASAMGPRHCVLLMRSNASGWSCPICITALAMASCIVSGLALSKKPFCKAYSCATCNIQILTPVAAKDDKEFDE